MHRKVGLRLPAITVIVLTAAVLFFGGTADGQTKQGLSIQSLDFLRPALQPEISPSVSSDVSMDGPVRPEEYFVGPNDLIAINIWSSAPREHKLTVTPEGTLLVPNVGPLGVTGETLARMKELVSAAVRKVYPTSTISVTLLAPRKIQVQITGSVVNEGPYDMQSVQRVDRLVEEANKPRQGHLGSQTFEQDRVIARRAASTRNIIIKHRDGSVSRVDLPRYEATGDGRWNPYLRDGDIVVVAERTLFERSIGVFGGVIRPGSFEFVPGDSLGDLLAMGMGLKPGADSMPAVLTRLSEDGRHMDTVQVDLRLLGKVNSGNLALRPGDRLVIREARDRRQNYFVAVAGEVRYPGAYPITLENTRLTEVLRAAGGFTDRAFIPGGTIFRASAVPLETDQEIEQEKLRSMRASLSLQDSGYYLVEMALRLKGEQVSIDCRKLFVEGDSSADIVLHPYDRIFIPPRQNTVYVFGQVLAPGHVALTEGASYADYVRMAGGYTNDARTGDVKIIKGGSRVWLDPAETQIEDGDFIWVPKEVHYPFSYYLSTYAQIAVILGSAATVALLIKSF